MANNEMPLRSLKVLEAGMENAFRSGDLGGAALLAWEILAVFPDQGFSAESTSRSCCEIPTLQVLTSRPFRATSLNW